MSESDPGPRPSFILLTPFEPATCASGARQRAAGHVKSLAALGAVHLVVVSDNPVMSLLEPGLADLCASVTQVANAPRMSQRRNQAIKSSGIFASLNFALSFPPEQGWAPEPDECREIMSGLALPEASLLIAFRVKTAWWAEAMERAGQQWPRRRVVDFDDLDSQARWRSLFTSWRGLGLITNLMHAVHALKTSWIEAAILRRWHLVTVASRTAEQALNRKRWPARVATLPNRIAVAGQPAALPARGPRLRLLFVGSLDYSPNVTGLIWFLDQVLPLVEAVGQAVSITVVGANPVERVRALAASGKVALHANVPSVSPFYEAADVVIVPLLDGSGTRIKILEAMAHGRPVISTPIGAEGLDLVPERDILIAASPRAFAGAVGRIGANMGMARTLATNGFNRVKDGYSHRVVEDLEQRLVLEVLHAGSAHRPVISLG